jgi:protein TonB
MRIRYGMKAFLRLSNKLLLMDANRQERTESASFAAANNHYADCGEKSNSRYFSPEFFLEADVLDIVFEGRNKEYGAYQLRKTYNRRLAKALSFTAAVIVLLFVTGLVLGRDSGRVKPLVTDGEVVLDSYKEKAPDVVVVPPPPKPIEQKIEIKQFTPPKIVKDVDAKDVPPPPVQDDLDQAKIGTVNQTGTADDNVVAPPMDNGKGVVEAPKKDEDDANKIFMKVEVESQFPGGAQAWLRFLNKTLRYPDDAMNNEITGRVIVRFIVDKEGNVSDVEAVSGPEQGGLREEAVRVIKKSGKWTPAMQNGRNVKSYKQQPVSFEMPTGN